MKANDWQTRFGVKRRATDKAYCAEAERAIAGEAKLTHAGAKLTDADTRAAIARAFGRPVH